MVRRAAALAALLTIGASGVSLAHEAPYLGNWARADGKTRIHVASCGAEICARNTWVRPCVSGEHVGDRLILKGQAGWRWTLVGDRFRSAAQADLRNQSSCHRQAHDDEGMRDGRAHVSKHGLEAHALIVAHPRHYATTVDTVAIPRQRDGERNAPQSPSPIHEQQHPCGDERRHCDEIG
jgi:hypothetical protein